MTWWVNIKWTSRLYFGNAMDGKSLFIFILWICVHNVSRLFLAAGGAKLKSYKFSARTKKK